MFNKIYIYLQVWDREIILTALADYYDKDTELLLQDIVANFTDVRTRHVIPEIQKKRFFQFSDHWNAALINMSNCYGDDQGVWHDDVSSWKDCDNLMKCPNKWASLTQSLTKTKKIILTSALSRLLFSFSHMQICNREYKYGLQMGIQRRYAWWNSSRYHNLDTKPKLRFSRLH